MNKVVFIGAGGYAESVYDSLEKEKYNLIGFIDDYKKGFHIGKPILGSEIEEIENFRSYLYFISIGDVKARFRWFEKLSELGLETINVIDKTAIISNQVEIGEGNFIGKMAVINVGTTLGNNNMINSMALVEHHCTIKNHTRIATSTVLNGDVVVEDGVYIGSNSCCVGQQKLGSFSVVGAGAVVIGDVDPYTTVVGVPGRILERR